MDKSEDEDNFFSDFEDETKLSDENLTDIRVVELGYNSATARKLLQGTCCVLGFSNDRRGVSGRIPRDVGSSGF
jgi:hypothetical protein